MKLDISMRDLDPHLMHVPWTHTSIGSVIFEQLIHVPNTETHRSRYMQSVL